MIIHFSKQSSYLAADLKGPNDIFEQGPYNS